MHTILSSEFWHSFLVQSATWTVIVLPAIAFIILLAILLRAMIRITIKRTQMLLVRRIVPADEHERREAEKRIETLLDIVHSAARLVLWMMVFMLILRKLGVDIAPLIAGAGIAGLALGFGAQEMVRDVIAGFFMLLENQVRVGDVAQVNGTGGLVEHVGLRTIVLRDQSGTVHVFQNGKINTLANMTKGWSAMVFNIGVAYKENTDRVVEIMKRVAEELRADETFGPKFLQPIEVLGVDSFGDSAVIIRARIKTHPIEQWNVGREFNRRLKFAFDAEGIEIPFPHRTLYWGSENGPLKVVSGNGAPPAAAAS